MRGRRPSKNPSGPDWGGVAFAMLFLALLFFTILAGKLPSAVLALYLGASLVAFFVYAYDKSAARKSQWRTKERTLHLLGLLGGWPGALIAQKTLRHKSSKQSFQAAFWATVVLNCGALLTYASIIGAGH